MTKIDGFLTSLKNCRRVQVHAVLLSRTRSTTVANCQQFKSFQPLLSFILRQTEVDAVVNLKTARAAQYHP